MPKDIFKYGKEGQCQPAQDVDVTYNITSAPQGPPGDPGLQGESAYQVAVRNGYVGTEAQWVASLKGATGAQGAPGRDGTAQGVKTSTVFRFYETTEANPLPPTPAGGDYNNPVPSGWSDTIPDVIAGQALFMSSRIFTDDGLPPQTPSWTTPFYAGDTEFVDFEYSLIPIDQNPGTPSTNPTVWQNGPLTGATWMAVRYKVGGVWGPWTVSSIKGEKGDQGLPGTPVETRYAVSGSPTVPPDLVNTDRSPVGWSTSSPNPATIGVGMYVWETRAQFNPTTDTLIGVWAIPVRLTGIAGDPGTSRSTLTSTVFRYWEVTDLSPTPPVPLPTDGDYDNPVPTDWHDTIPPPVMGESLFMMSRIFTSDTAYPQQPSWPTPTYAGDTEFVDMEYTMVQNDPGNPTDNPENWDNGPLVGAWHMAIRSKVGGHWGPWTVTKIRAEQGEKGDPGAGLQFKGHVNTTGDLPPTPLLGDAYVVLTDGLLYYFNGSSWESVPWIGPEGEQGPPGNRLERRYRLHTNATSAPTLNANVRNPPNWSLSMSTPGSTQYLWMTEAIIDGGSNTLIGVWSSPVRETGMPGATGANGTNGNGFQIMYAAVESFENPSALPENRWTSFVPTLTNTQSLYARMRSIPPSGSPGSWSVPVKMSGRDGTGTTGPSMAYRGDWFNNKAYKGSELVVDVVKYPAGPSGKGYIARVDAGTIPAGTLPTNTAYWNEFTDDVDSIFVDFLFAYSGYISNLTVGQIQTATEFERTSIGARPVERENHPNSGQFPMTGKLGVIYTADNTGIRYRWTGANYTQVSLSEYTRKSNFPTTGSSSVVYIDLNTTLYWLWNGSTYIIYGPFDPSKEWSPHGIRQYWPNGNIMSYIGYVDRFEKQDGTSLQQEWAIVVWRQDGSLHFVLDSTSISGIQYADVDSVRYDQIAHYRQVSTSLGAGATSDDLIDIMWGPSEGSPSIPRPMNSTHFCANYEWPMYTLYLGVNKSTTPPQIWKRTQTGAGVTYVTANNGTTSIPNGWYFLDTVPSGQVISAGDFEITLNVLVTLHYISSGVATSSRNLVVNTIYSRNSGGGNPYYIGECAVGTPKQPIF